jgi:LPXTG-motif cell wall-anchored protein
MSQNFTSCADSQDFRCPFGTTKRCRCDGESSMTWLIAAAIVIVLAVIIAGVGFFIYKRRKASVQFA